MSRFQMHVFVRHKKWGIKISNHNSHIVNIIPYKFIDGINVRAQKWLEEAKIGSVSYPKSTHETWNKTNTWICPLDTVTSCLLSLIYFIRTILIKSKIHVFTIKKALFNMTIWNSRVSNHINAYHLLLMLETLTLNNNKTKETSFQERG